MKDILILASSVAELNSSDDDNGLVDLWMLLVLCIGENATVGVVVAMEIAIVVKKEYFIFAEGLEYYCM